MEDERFFGIAAILLIRATIQCLSKRWRQLVIKQTVRVINVQVDATVYATLERLGNTSATGCLYSLSAHLILSSRQPSSGWLFKSRAWWQPPLMPLATVDCNQMPLSIHRFTFKILLSLTFRHIHGFCPVLFNFFVCFFIYFFFLLNITSESVWLDWNSWILGLTCMNVFSIVNIRMNLIRWWSLFGCCNELSTMFDRLELL